MIGRVSGCRNNLPLWLLYGSTREDGREPALALWEDGWLVSVRIDWRRWQSAGARPLGSKTFGYCRYGSSREDGREPALPLWEDSCLVVCGSTEKLIRSRDPALALWEDGCLVVEMDRLEKLARSRRFAREERRSASPQQSRVQMENALAGVLMRWPNERSETTTLSTQALGGDGGDVGAAVCRSKPVEELSRAPCPPTSSAFVSSHPMTSPVAN
jgi:hypothetical protein